MNIASLKELCTVMKPQIITWNNLCPNTLYYLLLLMHEIASLLANTYACYSCLAAVTCVLLSLYKHVYKLYAIILYIAILTAVLK